MKHCRTIFLTILFFTVWSQAAFSAVVPGQTYKLTTSGKMLSVLNSDLRHDADVVIWTETNVNAQRWTVQLNSDNSYRITNGYSGKMLYRKGAAADGAKIVQYDESDLIAGKWTLTPVANQQDVYYISQKSGTQTFHLEAVNTSDGGAVELKAPSNSTNQQWKIEPIALPKNRLTAAVRDEIMQRWKDKYLRNIPFWGWTLGNGGFWGDAEMLETILDAYETTGNPIHEEMFRNVYNGFTNRKGTNWGNNEFNDDITWIVIASVRAYLLFGDYGYLDNAKRNFDMMYARALMPSGMLRWKESTETQNGTNSCINGPAEVAACYLGIATGIDEYFTKAKNLYALQRQYLYEPSTGKVYDNFTWKNGQPADYNYWASTYNQGTFLGAALMLYNRYGDEQYLQDADKIMKFTVSDLCDSEGIVSVCQVGSGDLAGFKGILMRYVRRFIVEHRRTEYADWMMKNAFHAYNNRNSSGITSSAWLTKSPEDFGLKNCTQFCSFNTDPFGPSTIFSAAYNAPLPENPVVKHAFSRIEAENFNYLKGIHVKSGTDDATPEIGNIKNNFYTTYYNVDFGLNVAKSIELRVSTAKYSGTKIEIRLNNPSGTLIGTVNVPQSGSAWQTITQPIFPTGGMKNICFVYSSTGGSDDLLRVNYFTFSAESYIYPDITDNGGEISSSFPSISDTESAANLIDNNLETSFRCKTPGSTDVIEVKYCSPVPVLAKGYSLARGNDNASHYPVGWKFQGSTNQQNWVDLDVQTNQQFDNSFQKKQFNVTTSDLYTCFRLLVTQRSGASDEFQLAEWQIYGSGIYESDITDDGGILTAQYQGATADVGYEKLIDNTIDTKYSVENQSDIWLQYRGEGQYLVTSYSLTSADDASRRDPSSWTLYGSMDGKNWDRMDSRTNQIFPYRNVTHTYPCNTKDGYRFFKLHITASNGSPGIQLAEWQLIGSYFVDGFHNDITANGGELTSSQHPQSPEPALTFLTDNNGATFYSLAAQQLPVWVQYRSTTPVTLRGYSIMAADDVSKAPRNWRLQGSNDGEQWTDLDFRSNISFSLKGEQKFYPVSTSDEYRFLRLHVILLQDFSANELRMTEWEIHGTGLAAADATLSGGSITSEFDGITSMEDVSKLMDFSATSKYSTNWLTSSAWIQYQAVESAKISGYSITSANDYPDRDPKSWTLEGSNDGTTWTVIDRQVNQSFPARYSTQYYSCSKDVSANGFYRLNITENNGSNILQFSEWQLFTDKGTDTPMHDASNLLVTAYPNPVKDMLTVQMPEDGQIHVFNSVGSIIQSMQLKEGISFISFTEHTPGIYFLHIKVGEKTTTLKIIKHK